MLIAVRLSRRDNSEQQAKKEKRRRRTAAPERETVPRPRGTAEATSPSSSGVKRLSSFLVRGSNSSAIEKSLLSQCANMRGGREFGVVCTVFRAPCEYEGGRKSTANTQLHTVEYS